MVTHSSILAWRIPWTEEPGGLQFMGSQRVGHGWATKTHTHTHQTTTLHSPQPQPLASTILLSGSMDSINLGNSHRTSQVATVVKNLPANAGETRHTGSIPGLGRSSGVGNGKLFQYSCMENSVERGDWPWSLREFILLSSSMNLTNLSNSYKCIHTVLILLRLAYFT